mgnify:CR=1 FL=1
MTIKGVLTGIFIASNPNSLVSKRVSSVQVLECGFLGDKHTGWLRGADVRARRYPEGTVIWNSRQLSLVSEEELAFVASKLGIPEIKPEWLGANICIRGILDFSFLQPRTKVFIPDKDGGLDIGIYITAPNKPCIGPGKIIQANYPDVPDLAVEFPKAAINKRGVVAVVEHGGFIQEGAIVSVVVR